MPEQSSSSSCQPELASISFGQAWLFWLKLGFISFGGPAGQIALMHHELVERRRWISERRFLHALNYCMLLPGPEAQQLATYMGWLMHRTFGGLVAGGLFVLPSLLILIAFSWIYVVFGNTPIVSAVFFGIKPAVVAIVAVAAYRIGTRVLRNVTLGSIAAAAFVAIAALHWPFPAVIAVAGVVGYLGGKLAPARFAGAIAHQAIGNYGPAIIDDDTPPPAHAQFRWKRVITVFACAAVLWIGALGALFLLQGPSGTLTQMGWFFSKAALVTFGGAYAVLPYVYQGAVDQHGWLTTLQMMDGLALGETTPGPLIMVVAFIGFVGAWGHTPPEFLSAPVAGVLGALTVTYFTFLPSFVFIFLGAPIIEGTRTHAALNAVLTTITAAVVGAIINLALFFGYHVFWPQGFDGEFQWPSAFIAFIALVALLRFKSGIIPVILASGVAGIVLRLVS